MTPPTPLDALDLLATWLETLPQPHVLFDAQYRIVAANSAYQQVFGQDASVLGRTCYAVSHRSSVPCDQAGEACPLARAQYSGQSERVLHLHHTQRGQEHVAITLQPLRTGAGPAQYFLEKMELLPLGAAGPQPAALLGRSPAFQAVVEWLARAGRSTASVLLQGEPGTGKTLAAHVVHAASARAERPLVVVDCAALPEGLLELELFGQGRTGVPARPGWVEAAQGGSLLFKAIEHLPASLHPRLLQLLDGGTYRRVGSSELRQADVRIVATTSIDLRSQVQAQQWPAALYYRLSALPLLLPPLRERGADVVEIAQSFLTRQSERMGRDNMRFAHDAEQAIRHYPWPGNVRELENAIERSVILCEGSDISAELLGIDIELDDLEDGDFTEQSLQQGSSGNHEPTEDLSLEDYFQHFVLEHQDHMTETELARKLGISRKCLWERRQRLGIPRRKSGAATGS